MHEALETVTPALRAGLAQYYTVDGHVPAEGSLVRNAEYANTLRRVARDGPQGLWSDGGAQRFVAAAQRGFRASLIIERDLLDYRATERRPICGWFITNVVCTMAPPSYGGVVVLQTLQMLEQRADGRYDFADPAFVHLFAEAGKLAQADRRRHIGDPDLTGVPTYGLIDPAYLRQRARLIDAERAKSPQPGAPDKTLAMASDTGETTTMTSQIVIADRDGSIVAITTTVNLIFGAQIMVDGYVLNNALTNFSPAPKPGETIANQMAPHKRPVTSMAPTIVFDTSRTTPVIAGGAAGGGPIVDYISQSLIEMIANGRTAAQALAAPHVSTAVPGKLQLEKDTPIAALAPALRERGHEVEEVRLRSGLAFIKREPGGWIGAADPRRDGAAMTSGAP
jgi:gamma-glutamyltranspeptidase / glutathione hydrolase